MTTTLQDYQALALRTEKKLPTAQGRLEHAALGLFTEGGEIATCIKRIEIYGKSLDALEKAEPGKQPKTIRDHIGEEVGDACWYLAIAADVGGVNFFANTVAALQPHVHFGASPLKSASLALSAAVGQFAANTINPTGFPVSALDWSLVTVAQALVNIVFYADLNLEVICAANIAKLQERFPDAYSDAAAEARADKGGLDARNS